MNVRGHQLALSGRHDEDSGSCSRILAEVVSGFGVLFADYMRSSSRRAAIQPPTSTVAQ